MQECDNLMLVVATLFSRPGPRVSGVAFLFPNRPVGADSLEHGFGGVVQPLPFLFFEVTEDRFAGGQGAEVDVGGFPSHGVEQAELGTGRAQGSQFDAGAVGSKAANDPASAQLNKMIGTADGAIDDGLVEDFAGSVVLVRPGRGGWDERFGFAGDASAVPVGDGDVAAVAEAAESGDAVGETKGDVVRGHEVLEGVDGANGAFALEGGECVDLRPEMYGVAEFACSDAAKPLMIFTEHEGNTFFAHRLAVAFEHSSADVLAFDGEPSGLGGEVGADGEAD